MTSKRCVLITQAMKEIEDELAEYISVLASCAEKTTHANDRPTYTRHLSIAAVMFSDFRRSGSLAVLVEHVQTERCSYGKFYLSGPEGEEAEKAFYKFASFVESSATSE